jgi:hypothetical protein
MTRFRPGRPSPALVVAVIALIVALGGTGYAAITLPAHSVGTGQLKKAAVTTSKIRRDAVTTSKVKPDALSGRDINEARLQRVPGAHHADVADIATRAASSDLAISANKADTANKANSAISANRANTANSANTANTANNATALQGHGPGDFMSAGEYKRVLVKMQAGDERELVRNGPISVYARCATVAGNDELRMFARTDVDGAIMLASWGDVRDGTNANDFLNTTTTEANREWDNTANAGPGTPVAARTPTGVTKIVDHYDDNYVIAPSGEVISWESEAALMAFNYLGARCLIAGNVHLYMMG